MNTLLTFGPFQIDLVNETLRRGLDCLMLKPKSFAVLRSLVERPQQLVTKEELLDTHWGDVAVGDGVLKTCIGEIRQALGEQASKPQFIETVHRRGYRFVAAPTSVTPQAGPQATKPLVGRERECAQLHQWWELAKKGERQVIFVTGEPGIGKTSVVNAFLDQLTASRETWIGRGQCIEQYGVGEAYLPILEALNRLCHSAEGEHLVTVLRQYAPTWLIQLPSVLAPKDLQALVPTVVGATPVRVMRELAEALEAFTSEHHVLLSLEDVHWLDTSTLEILTYLARRSGPAKLLILGTYRPADLILHGHPLKGAKQELLVQGHCQELQLEYLTEPMVNDYLHNRFFEDAPDAQSLHSLAHVVHQRTEGNPLFMVNIVDYMLNQDLIVKEKPEWTVTKDPTVTTTPAGLRQFIDLRVEQLNNKDRIVLTVASVAGMEFNTATLAAALEMAIDDIDRRCHDLARQEQFIHNKGRTHWPDGTMAAQYAFQHALYQEALYEQTPLAEQIEFHRKIGERLEQAYGEQCRLVAVELALHFERGQDPDRASLYHQQAGEEALKRSAAREAILHLTKAIDFVKSLPPNLEQAQRELTAQSTLGIAQIHTQGFGSPNVEETFCRARELCNQIPDSPKLFHILYGLFRFYGSRSEHKLANHLSDQLLDLAQQINEPVSHILANVTKGVSLLLQGDFVAAKKLLEHSLALSQATHSRFMIIHYGEDARSISQFFLGWLHIICGSPQEGLRYSQASLATARELDHPFMIAGILMSSGVACQILGDTSANLEQAEEAVAIATKEGFPHWLASGLAQRGWAKGMQSRVEEGMADLEQGLAMLQTMHFRSYLPAHWASYVEVALKAKRYADGRKIIDEALGFVEETGQRWYEAELTRLKGELIRGLGEPDTRQADNEAEACFQEAVNISKKQGAKMFELRATMSLSRLWQQQGKGKQARPKLQKIYDWFTEGFDTKDLQEAKLLLSQLK